MEDEKERARDMRQIEYIYHTINRISKIKHKILMSEQKYLEIYWLIFFNDERHKFILIENRMTVKYYSQNSKNQGIGGNFKSTVDS